MPSFVSKSAGIWCFAQFEATRCCPTANPKERRRHRLVRLLHSRFSPEDRSCRNPSWWSRSCGWIPRRSHETELVHAIRSQNYMATFCRHFVHNEPSLTSISALTIIHGKIENQNGTASYSISIRRNESFSLQLSRGKVGII